MTRIANTLTAHHYLSAGSWGSISIDAFCYLFEQNRSARTISPKQWIVLPKEEDVEAFVEGLKFWGVDSTDISIYPANDPESLQGLSPTRNIPQQRILALQNWYHNPNAIMVSSVLGLMHRKLPKEVLNRYSLHLKIEEEYFSTIERIVDFSLKNNSGFIRNTVHDKIQTKLFFTFK